MHVNISGSNGIVITRGKEGLYFDPSKKNTVKAPLFISHAHSDHLGGLGSTGTCHATKGTLDILSQKRDKRVKNFKQIKYGNSVKINDIEVIAHNAGHMLGSAQFEIKGLESNITYTGDINYRDMLTTKAAVPLSSEVLIIESTYGNPDYVFPNLMETCMKITDWTIEEVRKNKMPVFKVYSAGKAQEVIKILNMFTALPVVTHPIVTKICQAYVNNGVNLMYVDSTNEEGKELLQGRECAFITSAYSSIPDFKTCSLATATGWAVRRYRMQNVNEAFPLSSHADFDQLVEYVKESKPRQVFTIYGFKEMFANYLSKKLGIRARPLSPKNQMSLSEFL
jgi:Cft2 family RNA processing exonuclease